MGEETVGRDVRRHFNESRPETGGDDKGSKVVIEENEPNEEFTTIRCVPD